MKIAFFAYDLSESSGWGRYTVQIVKRLAQRGVEPVFFSIRGSAPNPVFADYPHYPILDSYEDGWIKPLQLVRDMLAVAPKIKDCHALHCMVEPFLPLAWLLSRGRKLYCGAVGTYTVTTLKSRWGFLYRPAFRSCDGILSISRYTAMRLAQILPGAAARTTTVPLGVEMAADGKIPPAARREPAFLTVGAVKPRKGVLEAVKALGMVAKDFPQAKFYIVGKETPSPYIDLVKQETARLGLEKNVVWKGRVSQEELDSLYASVRGFVLPSLNAGEHFEGFGLVHLEANALGVPAIGSHDCGNEDAIKDGVSGFLVKQGDIEGLAAAMRKLIDPAFPWDDLSRSALGFAREMSWERTVEGYLEAYRRTAA
jgi:glycosyltransferase involved in cell wall biosynthesis